MNKLLIFGAAVILTLAHIPAASASISISFGTSARYQNGYYENCYYPCYNRYGRAYSCYPSTGMACRTVPQYQRYYPQPYSYYDSYYRYQNSPIILFSDSNRNYHKKYYKKHRDNRHHRR